MDANKIMSGQPKLVYFRSEIEKEKVNRFFSYWDNLQIAKTLDKEHFDKARQEIRSEITSILAKGILDTNPLTMKPQKRHVLSVNEIKEYVQSKLGKEVLKPNLYFHLNFLEENGLIQVVDTYGKSRNVSSYYGRTAKMFLLGEEKTKEDLEVLSHPNFKRFVKRVNPELDDKELEVTINKILKISKNDFTEIISWLGKQMSFFEDLEGIDQHEIFNLLTFLRISDSEIFEGVKNLRNQLKLG